MEKKNFREYADGFSLVEILIAMFLGLFLIEIVAKNYLTVKNIYRSQTELSHLNENIRFADFILWQHIMQAGFTGCRKISELQLTNHTGIDFNLSNAVYGYESSNLPWYLSGKAIKKGTDIIVMVRAGFDTATITGDIDVGAMSFEVSANPTTASNQYLLIADCEHGDLFVAKDQRGNVITVRKGLEHSYKSGIATVGRFEEQTFFISKTGQMNEKGEQVYSLYFSINRGNKRELIPGVSDMQIQYGIAGRYYKAREIEVAQLWSRVQSVMIELKMQGSTPLTKKMCIKLRGMS